MGYHRGSGTYFDSDVLNLPGHSGFHVTEARIAVGSVGPKPVRVPEAEELLRGKNVGELLETASQSGASVLDEAGRLAAQAAQPMDDLHGAADYKEHLVRVYLERVFAEAVGAEPADRRAAA